MMEQPHPGKCAKTAAEGGAGEQDGFWNAPTMFFGAQLV